MSFYLFTWYSSDTIIMCDLTGDKCNNKFELDRNNCNINYDQIANKDISPSNELYIKFMTNNIYYQ